MLSKNGIKFTNIVLANNIGLMIYFEQESQEVLIMTENIEVREDDQEQVKRVVLNSRNSEAIKEAMREVSQEIMKKNEELYRRLAYK